MWYKNENDAIVFASSSWFETSTFLPWKVNLKIWPQVRSGEDQAKVRSWPSRSICISSDAARRAKSLGTICASLSPSCRDLLAKNGLWHHLTSGDLHVTLNRQLHPDLHRWGEWPWSWKNWVVLIGLCETGSIFIFSPQAYITVRSRNWPDLRPPGKNPRHTFYRYWYD